MVALTNIAEKPTLTQYLVANKLIHLDVLDIGARGGFAPYWGHYRGCINIRGFDPDKQQERISDGKCKARALSGDGKDRVFYIIRYAASSVFYPPNVEFTNRLKNRDILNVVDTVELKTITLDSLNVQPDFIKLDTEGSELEILQGGAKTLTGVLGVSVEVEFVELFKGQPVFRDVDAFMISQGFTLYDIEPYRLERAIRNNGHHRTGQVIGGQALYFRDIFPKLDKYDEQTVLKLASLFELFGQTDSAFELLNTDRTQKYLELI